LPSPTQGDDPGPAYLRPYARAARVHGRGFGTLLWQSAEGQAARFAVIAEFVDPARHVIADLGCGRADLLAFLVDSGRPPRGYIGVDGIPEMTAAADAFIRDRAIPYASALPADFVADPGIFETLAAVHAADAFVFSGSLNTLDQPDALDLLGRAWAALPPAGLLVFNFLSDRYPALDRAEMGPARRFDTLAILAWALARSPLVRYRHYYLAGHDATIGMQRP
jgi:SAM-dependent methyltransferase